MTLIKWNFSESAKGPKVISEPEVEPRMNKMPMEGGKCHADIETQKVEGVTNPREATK